MKLKRLIARTVVAGGLGASALGLGTGMAAADPPHPGPGPGWQQPQPGRDWQHPQRSDVRWEDRDGYDRAVRDHRPFQYQGQWVNPVFDNGHQGWGFWLGPIWIPLL